MDIDADRVPPDGAFPAPVWHVNGRYEFHPPLRMKGEGGETEIRVVDETRFKVREDGWNRTLVAEPRVSRPAKL